MRVVADTGPLLAATYRADTAHELAATLVTGLGRELVVPSTVVVEVDQLLRSRLGSRPARAFLRALGAGEHAPAILSPGLLRRAVEFDSQYADLDLGLVDSSVMAYAERHDLPILTFDFEDFCAAAPERRHWRLVIDEHRYREGSRLRAHWGAKPRPFAAAAGGGSDSVRAVAEGIHEVPVWPSGVMSFDGRILEVTTGDGLRVAAADIKSMEIGKSRLGRLSVKLAYSAGLGNAKTSYWVAGEHEAAVRDLIAAVTGA